MSVDPLVQPALELLEAIKSELESMLELSPSDQAGVDRLVKVMTYVEPRLVAADSDLLQQGLVQGIMADLQLVRQGPAYADQAAEALVTRLPYLHPVGVNDEIVAGLAEAGNRMRKRMTEAARAAARRVSDAAVDLDARRATVEGQIAGAESRLDERIAQARSELDAVRQEVVQLRAQEQEAFEQERSTREASWADYEARHDERLKGVEARGKDRIDAFVEAAEAKQSEIEGIAVQAGVVAGEIAATATAEHYEKEAKREQRNAFWWRIATVAVLIAAVIPPVLIVTAGDRGATRVIAKLAITTVLSALAGYTASQSAVHRRGQHRARTTALELRAFGPFVAPLPEDQREIEHVIFTRRTFGAPSQGETEADDATAFMRAARLLRRRGSDAPE